MQKLMKEDRRRYQGSPVSACNKELTGRRGNAPKNKCLHIGMFGGVDPFTLGKVFHASAMKSIWILSKAQKNQPWKAPTP